MRVQTRLSTKERGKIGSEDFRGRTWGTPNRNPAPVSILFNKPFTFIINLRNPQVPNTSAEFFSPPHQLPLERPTHPIPKRRHLSLLLLPLRHPTQHKTNLLRMHIHDRLRRQTWRRLIRKNIILIPMMYRVLNQDKRLIDCARPILCRSVEGACVRCCRTPRIPFSVDDC